jgi:hypothetical protein
MIEAYQPQFLQQKFVRQEKQGSADKVSGQIGFVNNTQQTLQINSLKVTGPGYYFVFTPKQKIVRPKQEFTMLFRGRFQTVGKFQIIAKIPLGRSNSRSIMGHHVFELYYKVRGAKQQQRFFQVSNYGDLFLKEGSYKEPGMGEVFKSQKENPRYPQTKPVRFPDLRKYPQRSNPDSIHKIPTGSALIKRKQRPRNGRIFRPRILPVFPVYSLNKEEESFTTLGTINARGKFSWLGTDNRYHSAFGWRVRAWTRRNSSSSWTKRAEDWIQWDGKWSLRFHRPSGHRVKFQYIAFNRFFRPQSNGGDTYRWVGPEHTSISSTHNEGSWSANTSTGNVRGLGEMYHEGMLLWSKLYWTGQINPLRGSAIQVVFPNLSYDCGSGTGNPWSCASTGGNIWLIPAHALAQGVMAHELSHQVNYEFWNNNRPPNSGGPHTLTGCFTKGLALLEGFADFMESWLYDNRSDANPNASGINLEVVPNNVCQSISRNETYVAATFWDLHDKHFDVKDNLWFIHPGAVPGIYLRVGKKNSMENFRTVYRNAANSEHESIIDDIFKQNKNSALLQLTNS